MNILKNLLSNFIIFLCGGCLYYIVELAYRGYSFSSMFLIGGICFLLIGQLNERYYKWDMALVSQMFISCLMITIIEFISGYILNIKMGLHIWTYSDTPYNLMGQICLLYSTFWFWLSLPAIFIDDWIRHKLFYEDYKTYKFL